MVADGINIGSIKSDEEIIIRFNAKVETAENFAVGTIDLINKAFVKSDDLPEISTILPLTVIRTALSRVGGIQTGGERL